MKTVRQKIKELTEAKGLEMRLDLRRKEKYWIYKGTMPIAKCRTLKSVQEFLEAYNPNLPKIKTIMKQLNLDI